MLDARRLAIFREVARHGSFSRAAEALNYSQPAVSQAVGKLEQEAGAMLVIRTPRGILLTQAGELLAAHAELILERIEAAEANLADLAAMRHGALRLAAITTATETIMPRAIAQFRREVPDVEVSLAIAEVHDGLSGVLAGEFDIAVGHGAGPRSQAEETLRQEPLFDDPVYVVFPRGHPAAIRRDLRLAELAELSWILATPHGSPDAELLLASCRAAGFDPKISFTSDDFAAIQAFVAAGVGLAMVPDMNVAVSLRDDVVLVSLPDDIPARRMTATMLEGQQQSPAVRAMLAILRSTASAWVETRIEAGPQLAPEHHRTPALPSTEARAAPG
jgi:DNA-binding transcriptional LysR family regulator